MDRSTAIFVDGLGAAAATSGILNQLQGRIFALLYLQPRPIPLEDLAAELEQSKSNVSVNIRGLVEWHLTVLGPIVIPEPVERILDGALVCELTVISRVGHPISHPMIPLYDGEKLYLQLERPVLQKLTHIQIVWMEVHE